MIKLNNKNITYVALADSNNSLKAPKEIWYADSSNSVKLVYRRKDALIEGEDYEKYHLLKAEIPPQSVLMTIEIGNVFNYSRVYESIGNSSHLMTDGYQYYTSSPTMKGIGVWNGSRNVENKAVDFTNGLDVICTQDKLTFNSVEFPKYGFPANLRWNNSASIGGTNTVVKTSSITIDAIKRYIPCKLLKPVPKWLDANGIRRQVGECGMIDLVSGKFYGNVNSVGTFTVENYYERKEHLVSTNAYIDTKLKNITDKNITISFSYESNTSAGILFGSEVATPYNRITIAHYLVNDIYGIWLYDNKSGRQISEDYKNLTVILDATQSKTFVNGINITDYNPPQSELYDNILLFAYYRKQTIDSSASLITSPIGTMIDNFIVQNTMNLIPCTLTMDLPASMDANNIARTKGTSGMWDLVSDRFYGNVASSGTFKAVNLAEGVDYEMHQWLKGDDAYFVIPVNPYQEPLYVKFHPTSSESNHEFWSGYYNTSPNSPIEIRGMIGGSNELGIRFGIRENNVATATVIYKTGLDYLSDFSIETQYSEDNKVNYTFNGTPGTATPIIDSRANVNVQVMFKTTWCKFAKVTTDRINLTPCRLLRSIPSTYDANGIARQAGECGMYDTVNDVFYGNVASSGSFTVSDDN